MKKIDLNRMIPWASALVALGGCSPTEQVGSANVFFEPTEVIDLGALVTEDLPERVWGKGYLRDRGYSKPNSFDVMDWPLGDEGDMGSNAYYTLFNHGGPHVDAPNHVGLEGGLDSYPVESFAGPLKVFDVSSFPKGHSIPADVFADKDIKPGDVVLIYTDYSTPIGDDAYPETVTLMPEAAKYLAEIPIRAYGTNAWSVGNLQADPVDAETEIARLVPVHRAFLSRGIPVYEQLFNVDKLLGRENLYFVGVPLNIRDGDGMIVRPIVFAY